MYKAVWAPTFVTWVTTHTESWASRCHSTRSYQNISPNKDSASSCWLLRYAIIYVFPYPCDSLQGILVSTISLDLNNLTGSLCKCRYQTPFANKGLEVKKKVDQESASLKPASLVGD